MNQSLLKSAAIILVILAIIMLYLSYSIGAYPPGITGVGFIVIAVVFMRLKG